MFKYKTDAGDHLLKHLKKLSQSPIKVYIFLCSCNQPVTASIASIAAAVGLKKRATIDALNTLETHKLISRGPGRGTGRTNTASWSLFPWLRRPQNHRSIRQRRHHSRERFPSR